MVPGDLCAVELGEGEYRVVKILVMDDGMVHVRLYAEKLDERPFDVDPTQLEVGVIHKSFGIGHMPVSAEDFATWRPGVVGHETVKAKELGGYEIWRAAYEARMKPGLLGRR
jgi:hypothetical protein